MPFTRIMYRNSETSGENIVIMLYKLKACPKSLLWSLFFFHLVNVTFKSFLWTMEIPKSDRTKHNTAFLDLSSYPDCPFCQTCMTLKTFWTSTNERMSSWVPMVLNSHQNIFIGILQESGWKWSGTVLLFPYLTLFCWWSSTHDRKSWWCLKVFRKPWKRKHRGIW